MAITRFSFRSSASSARAMGSVFAISAILLGSTAISTLKTHNIEEGRGPALAGVVIGAIALVAQLYMLWYYIKVGI